MHSALFVTTPSADTKDWTGFNDALQAKLKPSEGVLQLAENVWLVDLKKSVSSFGWLIAQSERFGVSYAILPFEHEPEWLPGGFDPKTIQDRTAS